MVRETRAYVGLGSNLGDRCSQIRAALDRLDQIPGVRVCRVSELREVPALTQSPQPSYLNGVTEVTTTLDAVAFFQVLMDIEKILGRERTGHWAPRTLDLDLLLFGSEVITRPDLVVPHPQMLLRHFVLEPLAKLAPDLCPPGLSVPVSQWARRVNGASFIRDPDQPRLIAVTGNIGVGKTTLVERLAPHLGARVLYEPYETNPFLAQVYAGHRELALDSQLYFLINRVEQLSPTALVAGDVYVADYGFDQDPIYARQLLDSSQLDLYHRLFQSLSRQITPPTLVLYLRDETDGCLQRIQRRGRSYEQAIEVSFLDALDAAYQSLFADWRRSPVIRLNMPEFDSLREADLLDLVGQIRAYLGQEESGNNQPSSREDIEHARG